MGRRLIREVLPGLAAIVLLLALVVGVPAALVALIGWPLPRRLPSLGLETLRAPVDTSTLVNVLALVVWVAWAQFTACVLVEVKAAVAGAGLPAKVPLGGLNQLLARQLVAAVLLLTTSAAGLAPTRLGLGGGVPPRPPAATVQAGGAAAAPAAGATADGEAEAVLADATEPRRARKLYVVRPPQGRHHESLWEIAE